VIWCLATVNTVENFRCYFKQANLTTATSPSISMTAYLGVSVKILLTQVLELFPAARQHNVECPARVVVLPVLFSVFREVVDPEGEQPDLHWQCASIMLKFLQLSNQLVFLHLVLLCSIVVILNNGQPHILTMNKEVLSELTH
jgi:hypothetical protein